MKKNFFATVLFFLMTQPTFSQANTENQTSLDSILATLKKINVELEEKNYTRVPNKEFDDKLGLAISKDIDRRWTSLIAIIGGIGGIILYAMYRSVISNMKEEVRKDIEQKEKSITEKVDKKFSDLTASLTEKISHVYLTTVKDQYEKQISDLEKIFQSKIYEVDSKMKDVDLKMVNASGNMMRTELNDIRYTGKYEPEDFNKLIEFAGKAEQMNDNRLMSDILNELSLAAYYTKKEKESQELFDKHMDKFGIDIKENSFINLASAMFYSFVPTRDTSTMNKAFIYINKSLEKVPDYGEALGLKLEFLMVEFEKAKGEEKGLIKEEIESVFSQIEQSQYSQQEVVARFNRVSANPVEKKYITLLEAEFKDQMDKLMSTRNPQAPTGGNPEKN